MNEWKEYRLIDFMEFNPKLSLKKGTIAKKIAMENLIPYSRDIYSWTDEPYMGGAKFQNGDTIMARITPCLENGKHAYVSILNNDEIAYGSTEYIVMRGKECISDNRFIYYLTHFPQFKQTAIKSMVGSSGRQRAQVDVLENLWMKLPELPEQIRISEFLTALDDKIAINRRIFANLEEQAHAIFKHWFIDFTPFKAGKFIDSELGMIPEGWKVASLAEYTENLTGYSYKGNELQPSTTAMATIKNFIRGGGFKTEGYKEIVISKNIKEYQYVNMFDVLVAHTDLTQNAEVIGNPAIILSTAGYDKLIMSMDLTKVVSKDARITSPLLHSILSTRKFKEHALGYVNGTTVLHMNKKAVPEYKLAMPINLDSLADLSAILEDLYQEMSKIYAENNNLSDLRDTLLPKLMSGQIKL